MVGIKVKPEKAYKKLSRVAGHRALSGQLVISISVRKLNNAVTLGEVRPRTLPADWSSHRIAKAAHHADSLLLPVIQISVYPNRHRESQVGLEEGL